MPSAIHNRLSELRKSRGIAVSALAASVGVTRQTIYAIESGTYVPNTEVALRLARELEATVDDLFSLPTIPRTSQEPLKADVLSAAPPPAGQPVQVCRIGDRWVSVPVSASPYFLPEADGVLTKGGRTTTFSPDAVSDRRLVLAGCDPATSLVSAMVQHASGVQVVSAAASSKLALSWLKQGKVHIAGSHLEDAATGEFNLPYIRREFPDGDFRVVTFARWEEGLVLAAGNPKSILRIEDLARKDVRFINREPGSGSRALADKLFQKAGIPAKIVNGYGRAAHGHLAVAYSVMTGDVDCCIASRSAARAFGLDFIPLNSERYDLVLRRDTMDLPAAKAFLDALQHATLRRKLEILAGYDTAQTGALVGQGKTV